MDITTRKVSKVVVLSKENRALWYLNQDVEMGPILLGEYADYEAYPDKSNLVFSTNVPIGRIPYLPSTFELFEEVSSSNVDRVNELRNDPNNADLTFSVIPNTGNFLVGKKIYYLRPDDYNYALYEEGEVVKGDILPLSIYHPDSKIFAVEPPMENYILNETTYKYEPDPNLEYDLHGDGKLYKWDTESEGWVPTWSPTAE